jgi:hypothetical protein
MTGQHDEANGSIQWPQMEKEDDTRRIKTTRDVIYLIKFIHKIEID